MNDATQESNSDVVQTEMMTEQNINTAYSSDSHGEEVREENNNTFTIKKFTELAACIAAYVGIFSLLGAFLEKYASCGYCLYFYFDMDYFDFSLKDSFLFEFTILIVAGVFGVLIGTGVYVLVKKLFQYPEVCRFYQNKKIRKFVSALIVLGIIIFLIYWLWKLLMPADELLKTMCFFTTFICVCTFCCLYAFLVRTCKKNILISVVVLFIMLIILIACSSTNTDFTNAKRQRDFPIILESNQTYVVISQGKETYSSYECSLDKASDTLNIVIDKHKYFKIQTTKTSVVHFDKIQIKETKPITVSQFLKNSVNEVTK